MQKGLDRESGYAMIAAMRNFQSDFDRQRRNFTIMRNLCVGFIGLVFCAIICWYGFLAYVAIGAAGDIRQNGVRGVVSEVWCGKNNPGCLDKDLDKAFRNQ